MQIISVSRSELVFLGRGAIYVLRSLPFAILTDELFSVYRFSNSQFRQTVPNFCLWLFFVTDSCKNIFIP